LCLCLCLCLPSALTTGGPHICLGEALKPVLRRVFRSTDEKHRLYRIFSLIERIASTDKIWAAAVAISFYGSARRQSAL
jgi:hypothetical protein